MEQKKKVKPIDGNTLYRIEELLYESAERVCPDNEEALMLMEQVLFDIDNMPELSCRDCLYEKTHILCDHCARGYADLWSSASLAKLKHKLDKDPEENE